jgi:hypothetical protein
METRRRLTMKIVILFHYLFFSRVRNRISLNIDLGSKFEVGKILTDRDRNDGTRPTFDDDDQWRAA